MRWRDWPWASKLAVLLAALAIGPLALLTLYNDLSTRRELLAALRAQALQQAESTARAIERYLDNVLADLRVIALAPATVRLLAGGAEPALAADVRSALVQLGVTHGFDAAYLTSQSGDVVLASDPRLVGRNVIATRSFLQAIAGRAGFVQPRYEPEDRQVYLQLFAPVRQAEGPIVGTVIGRVTLREIDRIVAADTDFAGRGEFGVLWDDLGIRLSHPTKPRLRFRPLEPLPPDLAASLASEQRFGPDTRELLAVAQGVTGILARSRWLLYDPFSDPHLRFETSRGAAVYGAIAPLLSRRWLYGVFAPEEKALAALRAQTRRNLLAALATGLLAVAAAVAAARWATRPLRLVGQTAQALAAGDTSRRVGLAQNDEVGRLAATFDAMAGAIARQEAELRAHASGLERAVRERTAREREARRRAEEANRVKDEFLSTVSHELRTPLNAILGWTWVLASGSLDAAATRRAIATIERNARVQGQIIDDLLDVSRIITGKLLLQVQPTELAQVIEAALEAVRPAAEAKEIRLTARLERAATATQGDPNRLQQVVWNLLSNAVKFTPRGGEVRVELARAGEQVELRVADTGIGIAPDFVAYVFDRFRQADSSTTRSHGGLGLGLAIVRHLVELHGGTVQAESPGPGQGATFTVRLPLRAPAQAAAGGEPAAVAAGAVSNGTSLAGVKVLVVDDEPETRELLPVLLGRYGAEVRTAASAAEAMTVLEQGVADVLVADIGMPGEDGYGLIGRVRRLDNRVAGIPAVALTAYAGERDRQRALAAGFQAHLAKPVEPADLAATVAALARGDARPA